MKLLIPAQIGFEIKVQSIKMVVIIFLRLMKMNWEIVENAPRSFKVGDRVRFDCSGFEVDYGTIVERHTENSWWIDWESDRSVKFGEENI